MCLCVSLHICMGIYHAYTCMHFCVCLHAYYIDNVSLFVCLHVCTYVPHHVHGGQRSHRSQFFPSNMWVLRIKHRSSGLMASTGCACVHVCVCACMHLQNLGVISGEPWSWIFEINSLGCPVSPRGPTFLCFPSTGALCPFLFMWVLGMELNFSLCTACPFLTDSHILLLVEGFFT